jgi:uncharacterized membrane protein YdjX (TVP38/TMEM64 family)
MARERLSLPFSLQRMWLFQILKAYRFSFLASLLLACVPLLVNASVGVWLYTHEPWFASLSVWGWLLFYAGFMAAMAFSLVSSTFLCLLGGYFNGWEALWYLLPTYLAAAALGFGAVRWLDGGKFRERLETVPAWQSAAQTFKSQALSMVVWTKVSPVLPFALTNFFWSFSGISFRVFMAGCLLGMLPRTLLAVWAGKQASALRVLFEQGEVPENYGWWILGLATMAALGLAYNLWKIARKVATTAKTESR